MESLHGAAEGLGNTGRTLAGLLPDGTPGKQTLTEASQSLQGAIGAPKGYLPAGPKIAEALRGGDLPTALSYLPRAALESSADLAGGLAAGAVGGPLGAGAYFGARSLATTLRRAPRTTGGMPPPEPT